MVCCRLLLFTLFINYLLIQGVSTSCTEYAVYGDIAASSFLEKFWDPKANYLADSWIPNSNSGQNTGYWTYAEGFDSILAAAQRNATYSKK